MPIYDYDKHGHCIVCSKNMLIEEVIDGKVKRRYTPDYKEVEVLLSDNSRMRLAVCEGCVDDFHTQDMEAIMQKVIKGWELMVRESDWTDEKKTAYMERYSQLRIVGL